LLAAEMRWVSDKAESCGLEASMALKMLNPTTNNDDNLSKGCLLFAYLPVDNWCLLGNFRHVIFQRNIMLDQRRKSDFTDNRVTLENGLVERS
jgi:hypothetical protein